MNDVLPALKYGVSLSPLSHEKFSTECFRSKLDYNFHQSYSLERQAFQDQLLNQFFSSKNLSPSDSPQLIFTAGCMGSGKTHSIKKLAPQLGINLENCIMIDPDKFKEMIPEYQEMKKTNPKEAGTYHHLESAILSELALEIALNNNYHIICDGSLVAHQWYSSEINRIKEQYPSYLHHISIVYVRANWDKIVKRVNKRCLITGRCVDQTKLQLIHQKIEHSISILESFVDQVIYVDNNHTPLIESRHISVKPNSAFQSNNNSARVASE